MKAMRWLLILPCVYAAWWVALVIGFAYVGILDWLCPPEAMVSGLCTAPWYESAFDAGVVTGAGLAGGLVMLAAIVTAPSHRRYVAITAFIVGSTVAFYAAHVTNEWGAFMAASLVGLVVMGVSMRALA